MELSNILRTIRFGNYTNDELNMLGNAIRYRRSLLTEEKKDFLFPGLHVKFTHSRNGKVVTGVVEKVNRKFVIVRENRGNLLATNWRVPATMLERA